MRKTEIFSKKPSYKKSSVAIGIDYLRNSYPAIWQNNSHIYGKSDYTNTSIYSQAALWAAYYYKNKYALRIYTTCLDQWAGYTPIDKMPKDFLASRQCTFYDFTIGYNLIGNHIPKLSSWLYAAHTAILCLASRHFHTTCLPVSSLAYVTNTKMNIIHTPKNVYPEISL